MYPYFISNDSIGSNCEYPLNSFLASSSSQRIAENESGGFCVNRNANLYYSLDFATNFHSMLLLVTTIAFTEYNDNKLNTLESVFSITRGIVNFPGLEIRLRRLFIRLGLVTILSESK